MKSPFTKSRDAVANTTERHVSNAFARSSEHREKSAPVESLFCKLGSQIDSGFARLCFTVIEHAGESNMDDHFRTALNAAMEELLEHRRECPVCNKGASHIGFVDRITSVGMPGSVDRTDDIKHVHE